ncbi:hypothetical protein ACFL1S_02625 [Pseudomonadota bacterium]
MAAGHRGSICPGELLKMLVYGFVRFATKPNNVGLDPVVRPHATKLPLPIAICAYGRLYFTGARRDPVTATVEHRLPHLGCK